MLKIKDQDYSKLEVIKYLKLLKDFQKKQTSQEITIYSKLPLYFAVKYKIFYKNILLHPLLILERKFFEEKKQINNEIDLIETLGEILKFEVTSNAEVLSVTERTLMIKIFNKLKKKIEVSSS